MDSQTMQTESAAASGSLALWQSSLIAFVAALAVNLIILYFTKPLAPDLMSLTAFPVTFWTLIACVGAAVAYALTRAYAKNPNQTFTRISIAALLLSFLMDIPLFFYDIDFFAGATTSGIVVLMSMHVTIAMIVVPLFVRCTKPAH